MTLGTAACQAPGGSWSCLRPPAPLHGFPAASRNPEVGTTSAPTNAVGAIAMRDARQADVSRRLPAEAMRGAIAGSRTGNDATQQASGGSVLSIGRICDEWRDPASRDSICRARPSSRVRSPLGGWAQQNERPLEDAPSRRKQRKGSWPTRVQYGALPYRVDVDGSVEVLLVTSRGTKRWIIPKGWPIKGLKAAKAAAREAFEEAGVQGRVTRRALGRYLYEKRLEDRPATIPCDVQVFPLAVRRQLKNWPEANQRTTRWYSAAEAAAVVTDDGLRPLILQLEQQKGAPR